MARTGGNPDLVEHQFEQKYQWDEPCKFLVGVMVPPKLGKKLKSLPGWQEKVRRAIADLLDEEAIAEE